MIRRCVAVSAACLLLAGSVFGADSTAWAGPPSTAGARPAEAVNLLGNPDFIASASGTPQGWTCDAATGTEEDQPGSEFIQRALSDPEVPDVPLTGAAGPMAATAPGVTVVPVEPSAPSIWLAGTPTTREAAECTQVVPVRGGARYTLSVQVTSGDVVLGTEYGEVSGAGGLLTTTFTTARDADLVRVRIGGRRGGSAYRAAHAVLSGPPSRTRRPASPAGVASGVKTSRWVWVAWTPVAGASRYEVRVDGVTVGGPTSTAVLVRGLALNTPYTVSVVAMDDAGRSAPSPTTTIQGAPAYPDPPAAPAWNSVAVGVNADGTGFAVVSFAEPATATDGDFLYVDGVRTGWFSGSPGLTLALTAGPHTLQLSSINSAGESPLSDPYPILVGAA